MNNKKNTYAENMYNLLKRKGLADKYEHAGIYCIKIDDDIVYVGKSHNMLRRVSQHCVGINTQSELKYRILSEAHRKGHRIVYDVLYYASHGSYYDVRDEIGNKEGEYIRQYNPVLNTQIPHLDNWRRFDVRHIPVREFLQTL